MAVAVAVAAVTTTVAEWLTILELDGTLEFDLIASDCQCTVVFPKSSSIWVDSDFDLTNTPPHPPATNYPLLLY